MAITLDNNINSKMKLKNLKKVFRTIWKYGPIERKDIQDYVKLSWGAISQFSNQLIDSGIVIQNSNPSGSVGKIPSTIDVNPDDNYLIGIDLSANTIRGLILNLKGQIIESQISTVMNPAQVINQVISVVESLSANYRDQKNILAIGISAAGNVDTENGILLQLVHAPSWKNVEFKKELENHFHIPTFLLRDPDCVMMAEKYFGSVFEHQFKNVISVNLNIGIGMSILIDSKIYSSIGKDNGEIGHVTVKPGGSACNCGKLGCLEMYSSKIGIIQQFVEAINQGATSSITSSNSFDINYESIQLHAKMGDELCCSLFRQAGSMMGHVFATISSIMDPEAIILYGHLINARDLWEDSFMETFRAEVYPQNKTEIIFSELDASAPMVGVAFYAFDLIMDDFLTKATAKPEAN